MNRDRQSGFSLIELLIGLLVSSIVLAGAFSLWNTHQQEGFRLEKKIELRNVMTLSSKRIQRSVTLAGLGLGGAANLAKEDAVGSDTLTIFTNPGENSCALLSNVTPGGSPIIQVADPSLFASARYVAISNDTNGEIRLIVGRPGSALEIESPFTHAFNTASSHAYPAVRERYYTDQVNNTLMRENGGEPTIVAKDVKNFQVSFRDKHGAPTESTPEVRTVVFSFTGIFPAKEGALNSMIFSSTAIPRNTL
ncbi:MAG TPA: prepilin-type N-terminal cleavage/methylation domain-containing protein [Fibrobacteria bacterium]|nr:prepilin-type N-terminal cleavage/methylation domain-containing protein [Fibrobacteria bacterium]